MPPIRVLVVDDSVVIRRIVTMVLTEDPDITVVGSAPNGKVALEKVDQLVPDAVTLDVEMPIMDGVTAVRHIRRKHPRLPVVMFSTLTERGAEATLDALAAGASDYVTKPANVGSVAQSMENIRTQLIPKLKALVAARRPAFGAPPAPRPALGAPSCLDSPVTDRFAPPERCHWCDGAGSQGCSRAGSREPSGTGRRPGPGSSPWTGRTRLGRRAGHRFLDGWPGRSDQRDSEPAC